MRLFRRRFRKRRGSKYHHRRSRFARRVTRAVVTSGTIKKATFAEFTAENLAQGDGSSRQLIIWTPWSSLVQGTGDFDFLGEAIFPRGLSIKGLLYFSATTATDVFVRFTYFWSRAQAAYTNGAIFGHLTTSAASPTQAPPNSNPQIFDDISNITTTPFVGSQFASRFDTTNIKVISTKTIHFNPGGNDAAVKPFKFFIKHPRRLLKFQNPGEQALTSAPNYPLVGNYYLICQVFGQGGTSNISNSTIVSMDMWAFTYFKNGPQ